MKQTSLPQEPDSGLQDAATTMSLGVTKHRESPPKLPSKIFIEDTKCTQSCNKLISSPKVPKSLKVIDEQE